MIFVLDANKQPLDMRETCKMIDDFADRLKSYLGVETATKYGNENAEQQRKWYSTIMRYEIADAIEDVAEQLKYEWEHQESEVEEYKDGWIPCGEEHPGKIGWYLVTSNDGVVKTGFFFENGWRPPRGETYLAWMPLPSAYKKGESNA